jgi:hypothetical protein
MIIDIYHNVRLVHSCTHTTHDHTDGVKETAKSGTKVFVCVARIAQSYDNEPYQKPWMRVSCIFIGLEINTYIV